MGIGYEIIISQHDIIGLESTEIKRDPEEPVIV